MTACLCPSCTKTPSPTYTERFRAECEIRYVASLPSMEGRKGYLRGVVGKRGQDARDRIVAALLEVHKQRLAA